MRLDLLEARAAVEWPKSRLVDLHARLGDWLEKFVEIEVREQPPPATHNPIVAVERELLPVAFSVEVGAYINAIRSSLDILAFALVRRHGLTVKDEQVQFPLARDEEAYRAGKFAGAEFLRALPAADRAMIDYLQPYSGGRGAALWMLHRLDILRKHRRLLDVRISPVHLWLQGTLKSGDFEPLATGTISVNEETVLGLIRKGVAVEFVQSRFYVAVDEPEYVGRKPVNAVLIHLAIEAERVIAMFDT